MPLRDYGPLEQGAYKAAYSVGSAETNRERGKADALKAAGSYEADIARAMKSSAEAALLNKRRADMDGAPDEFMQSVTGLNPQQLNDIGRAALTGWMQRAAGPPTPQGDAPQIEGPPPDWFTPDVKRRYNTGRAAVSLGQMAPGDSNADQLAKAFTAMSGNLREEDALGGGIDPANLARVMAASAGKPMRNVTGTGIDFDPYAAPGTSISTEPFDMANAMRNAATVQSAEKRAQATVDAAGVREHAAKSAQLALVKGYMEMGLSRDQAIELANTRKAAPLRDGAIEAYNNAYNQALYETQSKEFPQGNDEVAKQIAERAANNTVDYLTKNAGKFGMAEQAAKPQEPNASSGYTQEDYEFTAKKHGITVDEVKKRLGVE